MELLISSPNHVQFQSHFHSNFITQFFFTHNILLTVIFNLMVKFKKMPTEFVTSYGKFEGLPTWSFSLWPNFTKFKGCQHDFSKHHPPKKIPWKTVKTSLKKYLRSIFYVKFNFAENWTLITWHEKFRNKISPKKFVQKISLTKSRPKKFATFFAVFFYFTIGRRKIAKRNFPFFSPNNFAGYLYSPHFFANKISQTKFRKKKNLKKKS